MAHSFIQEIYWKEQPLKKPPAMPMKPLLQSAKFPGNLSYLYIRQPLLLDRLTFYDTHFVASPGEVQYLNIGVSANGAIKSLLCLTKKEIKVEIYEKIVGKNSAIFGNFHEKSRKGSIRDLFQYFEQPKFCAIFHEDFEYFEELIKNHRDLEDFEEKKKAIYEDLLEFIKCHEEDLPGYPRLQL